MPQPVHYGKNASHNAEENEHDHCPLERLRFRNSEYGCSEFDSQGSQNKKPNATANSHDSQQALPWILQRAIGGNDHSERKGRRSQGGNDERTAAVFTNFPLQLLETRFASHLLNAFFS